SSPLRSTARFVTANWNAPRWRLSGRTRPSPHDRKKRSGAGITRRRCVVRPVPPVAKSVAMVTFSRQKPLSRRGDAARFGLRGASFYCVRCLSGKGRAIAPERIMANPLLVAAARPARMVRALVGAGLIAIVLGACTTSNKGTADAYGDDQPAGTLYNQGLAYLNTGK